MFFDCNVGGFGVEFEDVGGGDMGVYLDWVCFMWNDFGGIFIEGMFFVLVIDLFVVYNKMVFFFY